jgi:hypothetical protein
MMLTVSPRRPRARSAPSHTPSRQAMQIRALMRAAEAAPRRKKKAAPAATGPSPPVAAAEAKEVATVAHGGVLVSEIAADGASGPSAATACGTTAADEPPPADEPLPAPGPPPPRPKRTMRRRFSLTLPSTLPGVVADAPPERQHQHHPRSSTAAAAVATAAEAAVGPRGFAQQAMPTAPAKKPALPTRKSLTADEHARREYLLQRQQQREVRRAHTDYGGGRILQAATSSPTGRYHPNTFRRGELHAADPHNNIGYYAVSGAPDNDRRLPDGEGFITSQAYIESLREYGDGRGGSGLRGVTFYSGLAQMHHRGLANNVRERPRASHALPMRIQRQPALRSRSHLLSRLSSSPLPTVSVTYATFVLTPPPPPPPRRYACVLGLHIPSLIRGDRISCRRLGRQKSTHRPMHRPVSRPPPPPHLIPPTPLQSYWLVPLAPWAWAQWRAPPRRSRASKRSSSSSAGDHSSRRSSSQRFGE